MLVANFIKDSAKDEARRNGFLVITKEIKFVKTTHLKFI